MSAFDVLDRPLNSAETQRAIEAILARVEQIHGLCGEGFPLYNDGAWKVSAGGSWLGGFWAGWWWLRAAAHLTAQGDATEHRIKRMGQALCGLLRQLRSFGIRQ